MLVKKEFAAEGLGKHSKTWSVPPGNGIQTCIIHNPVKEFDGGTVTLIASIPGQTSGDTRISTTKAFDSNECTSIVVNYNGTRRNSRMEISVTIFYQAIVSEKNMVARVPLSPRRSVLSSLTRIARSPSTLTPLSPPLTSSRISSSHDASAASHTNKDTDSNLPPTVIRTAENFPHLLVQQSTKSVPMVHLKKNQIFMLMIAFVIIVRVILNNGILRNHQLPTMKNFRDIEIKYFFFGLPFILSLSLIFSKKDNISKYKIFEVKFPFSFKGCSDIKNRSHCIWQAPRNMIILNYEKESEGLVQNRCNVILNKYNSDTFEDMLSITKEANGKGKACTSGKVTRVGTKSSTIMQKIDEPLSTHCDTLVVNYRGYSRWSKASGMVKVSYTRI